MLREPLEGFRMGAALQGMNPLVSTSPDLRREVELEVNTGGQLVNQSCPVMVLL